MRFDFKKIGWSVLCQIFSAPRPGMGDKEKALASSIVTRNLIAIIRWHVKPGLIKAHLKRISVYGSRRAINIFFTGNFYIALHFKKFLILRQEAPVCCRM